MADVSFILGVIGNVISLLVFLSPAKTFWRIVRNDSTEDFNSLPYICTLLSTSLWTYYGLSKPGGLLIATVNGAGAVLETVYVILFLIYSPQQFKIKTVVLVVLVDIVSFTAVFLVTFLLLDKQIRITVIGVLCVCLTLTMYGSPLAITIPNGIGFGLGTCQLILYLIYRKGKPKGEVLLHMDTDTDP